MLIEMQQKEREAQREADRNEREAERQLEMERIRSERDVALERLKMLITIQNYNAVRNRKGFLPLVYD